MGTGNSKDSPHNTILSPDKGMTGSNSAPSWSMRESMYARFVNLEEYREEVEADFTPVHILVIGKSGAGKSSLIRRLFRVEHDVVGPEEVSGRSGNQDISREWHHPNLPIVIHDSNGVGSVGSKSVATVEEFLNARQRDPVFSRRIHLVWYVFSVFDNRILDNAGLLKVVTRPEYNLSSKLQLIATHNDEDMQGRAYARNVEQHLDGLLEKAGLSTDAQAAKALKDGLVKVSNGSGSSLDDTSMVDLKALQQLSAKTMAFLQEEQGRSWAAAQAVDVEEKVRSSAKFIVRRRLWTSLTVPLGISLNGWQKQMLLVFSGLCRIWDVPMLFEETLLKNVVQGLNTPKPADSTFGFARTLWATLKALPGGVRWDLVGKDLLAPAPVDQPLKTLGLDVSMTMMLICSMTVVGYIAYFKASGLREGSTLNEVQAILYSFAAHHESKLQWSARSAYNSMFTGSFDQDLRRDAIEGQLIRFLLSLLPLGLPTVGASGTQLLAHQQDESYVGESSETLPRSASGSRRHSQDDLQLKLEDHSRMPLKLSEEEGETIPKTAPGSQNSCLMRQDIRDMGFHDFNQEFDSDRILVLFKSDGTCTLDDDHEPQVHITFFHVEAMCSVLGIGVPHSSVLLKGDTIQVIGAAKEEGWRDLWTDPAYQQLYSPRILEVSFPTLGSLSIQRSLQYSTEESVQMFGLGVAGSDLVISGQGTALGEGNADRGREMGRQAGKGKSTASREGDWTPDKKSVRDQTSGIGSSSGTAGPTTKPDQPTAAVTEAHTLTIEVILSPDDNKIEPCKPGGSVESLHDRIALKQFIMDTVLTVTFYQDQDFSSPSKEMDIKVRSMYGLQTFDESTSAPRDTEFESFGWYHNKLRTSFQALDSAASRLQETTDNTTPGSSGPTCTTGGEVVRGGQLGVRAGGGPVPVSLSGQLMSGSTTSRQVSVPSTFQARQVGDRTKLAWRTKLEPGIKPAGLMDKDTERERATCSGLLNTVTTEFKGHWTILKTERPHYSYDLIVSRRFYMVRRKKSTWYKLRTRVITKKVFEQKLTKKFFINHSFSHMLDATMKFRWTLKEMPKCPVDVMRV